MELKKTREEHLSYQKSSKEAFLKMHADGHLLVHVNGKYEKVSLKPCFPWTTPSRYLALVDYEGKELAFINSIDELEENSRHCLKQALVESGFSFEVMSVDKIEEEFELRRWWVTTRQGKRQFQTKLMDWPRVLPNGEVLIQDLYGDLYLISNLEEQSLDSKGLLTAFID